MPSQVDIQILLLTLFPCVMSSGASAMLDIHRVSPVRGQLEPYDPRTPKGCRYIQCTETPSELKVVQTYCLLTLGESISYYISGILGFAAARNSSYVRTASEAGTL